MSGAGDLAQRAALELLALTRLTWLVRRLSRARGLILAFDRVLPDDPPDFAPNAARQVKPAFLDAAIARLRRLGFDLVDLSEALRRLDAQDPGRPFAVLTFDGAWRDTQRHALPILRRHQAPFTLYVPTALVDGIGEVWREALEEIVIRQNALAVTYLGETVYFPTATLSEKQAAYAELHHRMRGMPEPDRVRLIRELAAQYDLDLAAHAGELVMDWTALRGFAADPLCTLGAGTVHGHELAKLPAAEARSEIEQSVRILKAQFGTAPVHLSYPIGDFTAAGDREFAIARELGLRSAVTRRPGALYPRHAHTPYALPRISVTGLLQARRHIDVYATGALFSLPGR